MYKRCVHLSYWVADSFGFVLPGLFEQHCAFVVVHGGAAVDGEARGDSKKASESCPHCSRV